VGISSFSTLKVKVSYLLFRSIIQNFLTSQSTFPTASRLTSEGAEFRSSFVVRASFRARRWPGFNPPPLSNASAKILRLYNFFLLLLSLLTVTWQRSTWNWHAASPCVLNKPADACSSGYTPRMRSNGNTKLITLLYWNSDTKLITLLYWKLLYSK
jgi:hypothetical protein